MSRIVPQVRRAGVGCGSFSKDSIAGNVDLNCPGRVFRHVGSDAKNGVEIPRYRRILSRAARNSAADRARNHHWPVDLATRQAQQYEKPQGRQPARASKTHQHPKGEIISICEEFHILMVGFDLRQSTAQGVGIGSRASVPHFSDARTTA